ncbi:MAG: hypothetical protein BWZ01_02690 [Deltaproteobacteria bacterium ADurb.BinA179]|nr:MAG: hypothetical protein BWZ01_02690 [Deltaproteobacteria bacterium ADurb.BinA179]
MQRRAAQGGIHTSIFQGQVEGVSMNQETVFTALGVEAPSRVREHGQGKVEPDDEASRNFRRDHPAVDSGAACDIEHDVACLRAERRHDHIRFLVERQAHEYPKQGVAPPEHTVIDRDDETRLHGMLGDRQGRAPLGSEIDEPALERIHGAACRAPDSVFGRLPQFSLPAPGADQSDPAEYAFLILHASLFFGYL